VLSCSSDESFGFVVYQRKSRVKSVKKVQGKAMLLRLVPCRDAGVTQNDAPAATAPVIAAA
jgi:hypothetical protein